MRTRLTPPRCSSAWRASGLKRWRACTAVRGEAMVRRYCARWQLRLAQRRSAPPESLPRYVEATHARRYRRFRSALMGDATIIEEFMHQVIFQPRVV